MGIRAQMDRAAGVDPKRFKEDATQTSNLQGFLDSPEDPYFFAVETEPADETAPQSAFPAKRKPTKASPQGKTPANSPTEKNKVGRSQAQPGKRKQAVTDGQRSSQSGVQKGPLSSSRGQEKGKSGHSAMEAPGSGKTANGHSLRPTCSPAISEALDAVESKLGGTQEAKPQALKGGEEVAREERGGQPTDRGRKAWLGGRASHRPALQQQSRLARATMPDNPDIQQVANTPQDGAARFVPPGERARTSETARLPEACTPQAGLRTPLLMRNALTAGLGRLLSGSIFKTPAPAVTVMEAQESGEQMEIQDSMLYALDGLCSDSAATHRQSALSLADLCATRRGRRAFRADGVVQEATTTTLQLLGRSWDTELAIAFAAILLSFARDAGSQGVLACRECLQLLRMLLRSRMREGCPVAEGSEKCAPSEDCVARVLQGGGLGKGLPKWICTSPAALALLAVAGATDPQQPSPASESIKAGLRNFGLLDALAEAVAPPFESGVFTDRSLWFLQTTLVSLENCSFACPENEAFLVSLKVPDHRGKAISLATSLVCLLKALSGAAAAQADHRLVHECLHCTLSVLMNMTHHNDSGCKQVKEAGGPEVAARLLSDIVHGACKQTLLESLDTISVVMGLLINVAENRYDDMQGLVDVDLPCGVRLLPILCRLMEEFSPREGAPWGKGAEACDELTAEELARHEEEGKAAILQVYSALLIGFLVAPRPELRAEVRGALAGGSLQAVAAGVQRCLQFYLDAGAITEKSEKSLRDLLASLQADA